MGAADFEPATLSRVKRDDITARKDRMCGAEPGWDSAGGRLKCRQIPRDVRRLGQQCLFVAASRSGLPDPCAAPYTDPEARPGAPRAAAGGGTGPARVIPAPIP